MKNKIKTGFLAMFICVLGGFMSCQDMLNINSNSYLDTKDNNLNTPNDTLYSVVGILKQLQKLSDRYVVVGELRGDLMSITENSDMDLQDIANFTATTDNPYVSTKEYYAVINNCNFYLQHVDTSVISGGKKVLKGEYAVVKAMRDWTYMQLVLNYGKAVYFTEPILSIADMNKDYPVLSPQQLIEKLLLDIPDFIDYTAYPTWGGSFSGFISGPMLAGDMLLWMGAYTGNRSYYELAANIYYSYIINNNNCRGAGFYLNNYMNSDFDVLDNSSWSFFSSEDISMIPASMTSSETLDWPPIMILTYPELTGNAFEYKVKPSQAAIDLWNNEVYVYYNSSTKELFYTKGDLRGNCTYSASSIQPCGSYYYAAEGDSLPTIAKYGYIVSNGSSYNSNFNPVINLYRIGQLYLRYAEALNGLEKPSLAFAVLKYGLSGEVLRDSTKINQSEITPLPPYCDFTDPKFSVNGNQSQTGIHSRGSGNPEQDTLYYSFRKETLQANSDYYGFPAALETLQDSIQFVDVMICKELGLETAFEGARFQDLMRLSIRRNDNGFLAKWVGRRNPALTATLMNQDKWYLPTPE